MEASIKKIKFEQLYNEHITTMSRGNGVCKDEAEDIFHRGNSKGESSPWLTALNSTQKMLRE